MHFLDLPEEIQEYAFYLAYSEHSATDTTRSPARSSFLPLLLVNRALHRIGTPILYYSIRLSNSATAALLARTLEDRPSLYVPHIRALHAASLFPTLPSILQALSSCPGRLANLDLGFNIRPTRADLDKYLLPGLSPFERDEPSAVAKCCEATVEALSAAFTALAPGPHTLVLKRLTVTSNKTYVDVAFGGLARALPLWTSLRSVKINFFLLAPSDASESPDSANSDGERALAPALARVPGLQSVRAPLPRNVNWSAAWPLVASNDALQRVEMTVPHVSARARLAPVIEPVPGRVTQAYYKLFPSAAGPNGTAPPAALTDLASVPSPSSSNALSPLPRASLAERLRGPVEVVSKFGHFYDRTDKTITLEDRTLTAEQILRDGDGGVSAWLVEARKHRRLVDLMLAGASDTRSGFYYY